LFVTVAEITVL